MIIQGNNLIISANSTPLAASKSCNIEVKADTIEVSDVNDGEWEHLRVGRKSWKVTTNHILKADFSSLVKLFAQGGIDSETEQYAQLGNELPRYTSDFNGISFYLYTFTNGQWQWDDILAYHYEDPSFANNVMRAIQEIGEGDIPYAYAIISCGTYSMTSAMATEFEDNTSIAYEDIYIGNDITNHPFAIVGVAGENGWKIAHKQAPTVSMETFLTDTGHNNTAQPVKDFALKVGTTVNLNMNVREFPSDTLSGTAICTQCKISGARGNLCTGAFTFEGNGPLQ